MVSFHAQWEGPAGWEKKTFLKLFQIYLGHIGDNGVAISGINYAPKNPSEGTFSKHSMGEEGNTNYP